MISPEGPAGYAERAAREVPPDRPETTPALWTEAELAENRAGRLAAGQREALSRAFDDAWMVIDGYRLYGRLGNDDRDFEVAGLPVLALTLGCAVTGKLAGGGDRIMLMLAFMSLVYAMLASTVRASRDELRRPRRRFRRALQRDLAAGRVAEGDAGVTFHDGRYASVLAGRTLPMTRDAARTLRAALGPHHVWFLPETGLVLWHEPRPGDRAAFDRALNLALARGHGFDPRWLEANRGGRLAPWQYGRVVRRHLRGLGAVALYTAATIAGCHLAWSEGLVGAGGFTVSIVAFALLVVVPALMLLFRVRTLARERWAGVVSSVVGPARVVMEPGKPAQHFYACGDVKLRMAVEQEDALAEGASYRLFFTPATQVLVGIEVVEPLS